MMELNYAPEKEIYFTKCVRCHIHGMVQHGYGPDPQVILNEQAAEIPGGTSPQSEK